MKRHVCTPRDGWREKVESIGLTYHSHENGAYWDESVCYEFSAAQVDQLEAAAQTLHELCVEAAGQVVRRGWWDRLRIPEAAIPLITHSWERSDFSLYGRFDLAFDGTGAPKLLEYNADTPTALVEAAVAQWFWLKDTHPGMDQFNSIHERLVEAWRKLEPGRVHLMSVSDSPEDEQTVMYLMDTCLAAGREARALHIEDMGWDNARRCFVDIESEPIDQCFKLYPWEWMVGEDFFQHLAIYPIRFVEPIWKMLLSNKGMLPILWELYSDHPNLLPAYETAEPLGGSYVSKPKLSREGANIAWVEAGQVLEQTSGAYEAQGRIFQSQAALPDFDGNFPVCGVWVVDHQVAGLGIREDRRRITGNLSRFVPHFFTPYAEGQPQ